MRWTTPQLEAEFLRVHPDVSAVLVGLDEWSRARNLPEVWVTHVLRTQKEQEEIYWPTLVKLHHLSEEAARAKARVRFSWHLVACAVDIRNRNYTGDELQAVMGYLNGRCTPGPWELLSHDVGRGSHVHVGRRDFTWRRRGGPAA
jgi:hypothetical protein